MPCLDLIVFIPDVFTILSGEQRNYTWLIIKNTFLIELYSQEEKDPSTI